VKQFLVEVFVPRSRASELADAKKRVRAAVRRVSRNDRDIRYVRAIYVPEDETCFYVFDASSAQLVEEVSSLAGLRNGRVVQTLEDSKGGRK
jgi:hypothetical protein